MDHLSEIKTKILPVDARNIGKITALPAGDDILDSIDIRLDSNSEDVTMLQLAAKQLRESDIPVAFPTETVYGLGADATRSSAVKGIYQAKQRPADNPLIVHIASLDQLRRLLRSSGASDTKTPNGSEVAGHTNGINKSDPIPEIYKPLISKLWPGPLTIILPTPPNSTLAPEVTAGLNTFGARMPRHILALALIKLSDKPIAAPSANASTKPSPTAAEHVYHDLSGRIETIIDGGPCDVGVESTVVDGLVTPPLILRPGGISLEQIRSCPGWENTLAGYKDASQGGESQPRAPGMKYRHYSPSATVVLYEAGSYPASIAEMVKYMGPAKKLGLITTTRWKVNESLSSVIEMTPELSQFQRNGNTLGRSGFAGMLDFEQNIPNLRGSMTQHTIEKDAIKLDVLQIALGSDTANIARGVFAALRELDRENVDAILVEGIDQDEGHTAAAIMNRLRKAAEVNIGD